VNRLSAEVITTVGMVGREVVEAKVGDQVRRGVLFRVSGGTCEEEGLSGAGYQDREAGQSRQVVRRSDQVAVEAHAI
jgi:hypothetical protein